MRTLLIAFLLIGSLVIIILLFAAVFGIELISKAFEFFEKFEGDSDDSE